MKKMAVTPVQTEKARRSISLQSTRAKMFVGFKSEGEAQMLWSNCRAYYLTHLEIPLSQQTQTHFDDSEHLLLDPAEHERHYLGSY